MKTRQAFLGIAVLLIAAIFTLTGCPPGDTGGDPLGTLNLTIAGSFASQNGGDEAIFYATTATNAMLSSRSIQSGDFALEGYLEDGDITFRLRGNYNSDTKTYVLSAASSFFRYSISGGFNAQGEAETGQATVQVKTGPSDDWQTFELEVEVTGTAPSIDTSGDIEDELAAGIPSQFHGIWRDSVDASYYVMISAFSAVTYEKIGTAWVETETLFFTDVSTASGITTGTTAFWDWDFDAIRAVRPGFWNDMIEAYTDLNGVELQIGYSKSPMDFDRTPAGEAIRNKPKYSELPRMVSFFSYRNEQFYPHAVVNSFQTSYEAYRDNWREENAPKNLYTHSEAMQIFRDGPGKATGDELGAYLHLAHVNWEFSPSATDVQISSFYDVYYPWLTIALPDVNAPNTELLQVMQNYMNGDGAAACAVVGAVIQETNIWLYDNTDDEEEKHAYHNAFNDWYYLNFIDLEVVLELMNAYRNGPGKAIADEYDIDIQTYLGRRPGLGYDMDNEDPLLRGYLDEIQGAYVAWCVANGYVHLYFEGIEEFYTSNYQETWLIANDFPKATYYKQFFARVAVRMVNGRLQAGVYHKPGNQMDWIVNNYGDVSQLSVIDWDEETLGR